MKKHLLSIFIFFIGNNLLAQTCTCSFTFVASSDTCVFTNTSSFVNAHYYWEFGDGQSSYLENPSHVFPESGEYLVTLYAKDTVTGCHNFDTILVVINKIVSTTTCIPYYTETFNGSNVTFSDNSTNCVGVTYVTMDYANVTGLPIASTATMNSQPAIYFNRMNIYSYDSLYGNILLRNFYKTLFNNFSPVSNYDSISPNFEYDVQYGAEAATVNLHAMNDSANSYVWTFEGYGNPFFYNGQDLSFSYPYNMIYDPSIRLNFVLQIQSPIGIRKVSKYVLIKNPLTDSCNLIGDFQSYLYPGTNTMLFSNTSQSHFGISSQYWQFGDGTTSNETNHVHAYLQPGIYNVVLQTYAYRNCSDTIYKTVVIPIVSAGCNAWFSFLPNNSTVAFSNQSASADSIVSFQWTFGNGDSSTLENPNYTFAASGNYYVCLKITTASCVDSICRQVSVPGSSLCNADFTISGNANPLEVNFQNTSTGTGTIYLWIFGDGATAVLQNPTHIYNQPGTYQVCLNVADASGSCYSTYCDSVVVPDITCNADFTYTTSGDTLFFYSLHPEYVSAFSWTFGDGTSSTLVNPVHVFATNPGLTDTICLNVATIKGCITTQCREVTFNSIGSCTAQFDYVVDSTALDVTFFNQSIVPPLSGNAYYNWSFGDQSVSNFTNPIHHYDSAGVYLLRLSLSTGGAGCFAGAYDTLFLGKQCQSNFDFAVDTAGTTLTFHNTAIVSDSIISYLWDFGDGQTSALANPIHTYSTSGIFSICLTITSASGCADSFCKTADIPVLSPCHPNFTYNVGPNGLVQFSGSSPCPESQIIWQYGDGNSLWSSDVFDYQVSHTYLTNNWYWVCLTVSALTSDGNSIYGQYTTYCDSIYVPFINGVNSLEKPYELLKVFPNPVSEDQKINLEFNNHESKTITIRILDTKGQCLSLYGMNGIVGENKIQLSVKNLANGIYFIQVVTSYKSFNGKFSIIRKN